MSKQGLPAAALLIGGFHGNVEPAPGPPVEAVTKTVVDRWDTERRVWRHYLLQRDETAGVFVQVCEVDSLGLRLKGEGR